MIKIWRNLKKIKNFRIKIFKIKFLNTKFKFSDKTKMLLH